MKCTCCKSQNDADPTQDIWPWESPVDVAFAEEVDGHAGVDRQSQERKKPCRNQTINTTHTEPRAADHYCVYEAEICSKRF